MDEHCEILLGPKNRPMYAIVDSDDLPYLASKCWYSYKRNDGNWIACAQFGSIPRAMHRIILGITDPKIHVDHINRNPLDNRRCNLRIADPKQSAMNRGRKRTAKSGYKGVSRARDHWRVSIKHLGVVHHIGMFDDPIEGAKAYDQKAYELQGEFAVLNFP
jgi:hypothetical protein